MQHKDLQKELFQHPMYSAIIRSNTFERLKGISFLGAIDYISDQSKRDNRYRHSLSVGALALLYSRLRELKQDDQDHLVAAALLHDIGHGPLSHSMESAFIEKFGLSHHISTSRIITGDSPAGQEIPSLLNQFKLDRDRILSLIQGTTGDKAGFALSNPINLDTADAIIRTYQYTFSKAQSELKTQAVPQPTDIVKALIDKDHTVLDRFWKLKETVYNTFIHNRLNLFVDFIAANFARQNDSLEKKDFFLTDQLFADKHSLSFNHLLRVHKRNLSSPKIRFYKRSYQIVKYTKLSDDYSVFKKYKHTKQLCSAAYPDNDFLPIIRVKKFSHSI